MAPRSEPAHTVWPLPFPLQDWEQTPPAVQAYGRPLDDEVAPRQDRVETREARLTQHATTSSRPPSSDAPDKKPRRRTTSTPPRQAGGKLGPPGQRPGLWAPTRVVEVWPEPGVCGNPALAGTSPD